MSWRDAVRGGACGVILATIFLATIFLATVLVAADALADDRSLERLRYTCSNELGRRDITLFANGTVRLREGPWEEQRMQLAELSPEELESQLRVLAEIRNDSVEQRSQFPRSGIDGPWVDRCELLLELPETVRVTIEFSQYDTPPLWVSRGIHAAEALAEKVHPSGPVERLPADYRPRPGDLLKSKSGQRFVVIALTGDNRGVELQALDAPLRWFHLLEDLRQEFTLLSRRGEQ